MKNKNKYFMSIFCILPWSQCLSLEINQNGCWVGDASNHHCHDSNLARAIEDFLVTNNARSVVDFGCGMGLYADHLQKIGLYCEAYDGNPLTPELTKGIGKVLDLSKSCNLDYEFDWVLSLEVGEHLPVEFETTFIENLIHHSRIGIILSWAVKGQGGDGHFNEQNNDYIKSTIAKYGLTNDIEAENQLRDNSTLSWFKNTIMVFRKSLY